jgi:glycosyltransferase involved in cell wall biosynthesis
VYDGVPIPARVSSRTGGIVAIVKNNAEAVLNTGVPVHIMSDLWQDLSTARVCVYWSQMEGLGSGALAAMGSGVPVIASRVGGLAELIEHERTGLLVDGPDQLAEAMRRLTANPREAEEMGARARETVQQKFSVEAMVQATLRAYEEAAA